MSNWLERLKERLTDDEMKRYLEFLALPFITILLIIVIVVADKPQAGGNENGAENVLSAAGTSVADETDAAVETDAASETDGPNAGDGASAADTALGPESVPYVLTGAEAEVTALMEQYFKARRSCDTNVLSAVYGGGLSADMLGTERQNMESDVRYYQYFENLACFTVPGLTEDSLVIYAKYDVKFRQSDTMAPGMAAWYAKKGADGSWYLAAEVSQEELDYMALANGSDAVQAMTREVNSALRGALESDTNLLAAYYELTGKDAEDNPE